MNVLKKRNRYAEHVKRKQKTARAFRVLRLAAQLRQLLEEEKEEVGGSSSSAARSSSTKRAKVSASASAPSSMSNRTKESLREVFEVCDGDANGRLDLDELT